MSDSEKELARRCSQSRGRDEASFDVLVRMFQPRLEALASRLLKGTSVNPKDVVLRGFSDLLRAFKAGTRIDRPGSYLTRQLKLRCRWSLEHYCAALTSFAAAPSSV